MTLIKNIKNMTNKQKYIKSWEMTNKQIHFSNNSINDVLYN